MKNTLAILLLFSIVSCKQNTAEIPNNSANFLKTEIQNWKKQLVANGEIGKPCIADTQKWIQENPESYFGLPKQINSKSFDINGDKTDDFLLYFSAGESCTGGHDERSDFLKLIYSNGNSFLENDNLREKIASKIANKLIEQHKIEIKKTIFSITNFNTQISGTYQSWTNSDPDCCASISGNFKYNPISFRIEISKIN
jgi:hypothetical protein